jgi:hypothetical protein
LLLGGVFDAEFRARACELVVSSSKPRFRIAVDLGISDATLSEWMAKSTPKMAADKFKCLLCKGLLVQRKKCYLGILAGILTLGSCSGDSFKSSKTANCEALDELRDQINTRIGADQPFELLSSQSMQVESSDGELDSQLTQSRLVVLKRFEWVFGADVEGEGVFWTKSERKESFGFSARSESLNEIPTQWVRGRFDASQDATSATDMITVALNACLSANPKGTVSSLNSTDVKVDFAYPEPVDPQNKVKVMSAQFKLVIA